MDYIVAEKAPQKHRKYPAIELEVQQGAVQQAIDRYTPIEVIESHIDIPVQPNPMQVKQLVNTSAKTAFQTARFVAVPISIVMIVSFRVIVFVVMLILAIPVEIIENILAHNKAQTKAGTDDLSSHRKVKERSGNNINVQGNLYAKNINIYNR